MIDAMKERMMDLQMELYPYSSSYKEYTAFAEYHNLAARVVLIPAVAIDVALRTVSKIIKLIEDLGIVVFHSIGAPFSNECNFIYGMSYLRDVIYDAGDIVYIPIEAALQLIRVFQDPERVTRLCD